MKSVSVLELARQCLRETDVEEKLALTAQAADAWGRLPAGQGAVADALDLEVPGRPARPVLVAPRELKRRRLGSPAGRAALFHALAHIEFNAINLAWDAVVRFAALPEDYYRDWVRVAQEEAYHFGLLRDHLRGLGHDYGDFPAHNGLWDMARRTAHDPLVRMALVPRTLEARGLDASPALRDRVAASGDRRGSEILDIILRDEIGHVAIGDRWFRHLCQQRGLDAEPAYQQLLARYLPGPLQGPFHVEARRQAGFSEQELQRLSLAQRARR